MTAILRNDTSPGPNPGSASPQGVRKEGRRPHRYRHWTGPRMAAFLRALAATKSVAAAARSVAMSRQSAYRLRNRLPPGATFVEAWDMAFAAPPGALGGALSTNRESPCDLDTILHSKFWKDWEFEGDGLGYR